MSANIEKFVMAQGTENPWWGVANTITPDASLEQWMVEAGLNWKVCEMPLLIQGKAENRAAEGWKALVRSSDAKLLGCVSTDYNVHQNRDLVEVFRHFCEAGELKMDTMGSLAGGKKVFASARVNGDISIKTPKGMDVHKMHFLISTGHTGGYATQADLTDVRVVCNNTLTMAREATATSETRWKMSHLGRWTSRHAADVKALVDRALGRITSLTQEWETLYAAPMGRLEEALYFAELYQPDLYGQVVEHANANTIQVGRYSVGISSSSDRKETDQRLITLDALANDADERRAIVTTLLRPDKFNRTVTTLLDTSRSQLGVELSRGTAADPINAVTYWTDHDRGRNRESALDSAMFGTGRNEKATAMTLALDYASQLAQVHGVAGAGR